MTPLALGLLIAVDAAVLALAIRAPVRWQIRAGAVVLSLAAAFAIWLAASQTAGWPASAPLPADSRFVSCVVRPPAPGDAGRVYLWLIPSGGAPDPLVAAHAAAEPRAYSEPYSADLEATCQAAARSEAGGQAVGLRIAKRGRPANGGSPILTRGRFRAYVLPPPNPPPKTP